MALTLALPLLWACYDPDCSIPVPDAKKNQVRGAYELIRQGLDPMVNPVEKKRLVILDDQGSLRITEVSAVLAGEDDGTFGNGTGAVNVNVLIHEMRAIDSRITALQQQLMQVSASNQRTEASVQWSEKKCSILYLYQGKLTICTWQSIAYH